ncbi:MAG: 7-cyano-7-deazaguanine synthase QueC [Hyphomicrobiales bacterium]|nr:7-cyano-7-deazaguanine synthase QueC [Hyphomicrobiales bacterium]
MTDAPHASPTAEAAQDGALVLFSGGQDSATTLGWALARFPRVETVGFAYGQRHAVELEFRGRFRAALPAALSAHAGRLGPDHMIDLPALGALSETALTRASEIAFGESGLPNTFVPGRNLIFLAFAAALAYRRGLRHVALGVCETDYSGYPDCRDDTIKAMQVALNLGMDRRFVLHAPLMFLDKAATWSLARDIGGAPLLAAIRDLTLSCYLGETTTRHDWGVGCGTCPACGLRARGWARFVADGPR